MPRRARALVSEVETLRNLGPKSALWLKQVGILTRADLVRVGPIGACRLLRDAGHRVSTVMAYAIEGALMDCDWRALPFAFRRQLRLDFQRLSRTTVTKTAATD